MGNNLDGIYPDGALNDSPEGQKISADLEKLLFGKTDADWDGDLTDPVSKKLYGSGPDKGDFPKQS